MLKQALTDRTRNVVLAVAAAALAGILTLSYVGSYKRHVEEGQKRVPVLVATKVIPAGTSGADALEQKLFAPRDVPKQAAVSSAFSRPKQVRKLVAADPIYPGEQLTARRFRPLDERGVRGEINGAMRALQVPGDANQLLSGTLKTGDRVDVLGSIKFKVRDASGSDVERVASRIVLRNLLVLSAPRSPGGSGSASGQLAVQLALTDTQAQKLFFVMKNGEWTLQLRPAARATDSRQTVETAASVVGAALSERQKLELTGGGQIR